MNFSYFSRVATLMTVGACAGLSAAQAAPDAHDFGIEIEKPPASKPRPDTPKAAAPKVTTPKATAPKPASVPQPVEVVSVEAARVPLLLRQMEAGQLTPQAAWQSGALTREGLLFLFERHLDVWKLTEANPHRELYLQLAGLLAPQMSEVAKPSRRVRLWLGEFYRVQQDERAAALLESVLGEFKAPVKSKDPVLFLAAERLAWFYQAAGQFEKAAQTWLRLEELSSDTHWKADAQFEAGRSFELADEMGKAREIYRDVQNFGAEKYTFLALKNLAFSYYRTGDFDQAEKTCQQIIERAQIKNLPPEANGATLSARSMEQYIARWRTTPLKLYISSLAVAVGSLKSESERKSTFLVEVPPSSRLSVQGDKRLKVELSMEQSPPSARQEGLQPDLKFPLPLSSQTPRIDDTLAKVYRVSVQAAPNQSQPFDSFLNLKIIDNPESEIKIPVRVLRIGPVTVFPLDVFFGFIEVGKGQEQQIKLTSSKPFKVLTVEGGTEFLTAQVDNTLAQPEHTVTLRLAPKTANQILQGEIRISTDAPSQEVITVPYLGTGQ